MHVTAMQTQTKTNGEWGNHAGSILLECLYSDSDVIVLCQWVNKQQNYFQRHSQIVTVVAE